MKEFKLIRVAETPECTYGVLSLGEPVCLTLELPWLNNEKNKSRIPAGRYVAKRRAYKEKLTAGAGYTYELQGVPGRSGILIHVGNYAWDSKGCILPGTAFSILEERCGMVTDSRIAFIKFTKAAGDDPFIAINIIDV